ncbi:MAG TPA: hypothetical protein VLZ03_02730 [Thermodesulfobacteriota bacterium]|nr:hypothetical protein [Thermodesulfobacteriota bacterium]
MNTIWQMDVRTVTLTASIIWFCSAVILVLIWHTRKPYHGFGCWTLNAVAATIGLLLLSLHGIVPTFFPVFIGNGLLLLGPLLVLQGVRFFRGRGRLHFSFWIALLLCECGLAYFLHVQPDINFRIALVSFFTGVISILIAWEIIRPPVTLRFSSTLIGVTGGIYGMLMFLRSFFAVLWYPLHTFFDPSILQSVIFLAALIVSVLTTFGLILINSERLEHDLKATGEKLEDSLAELKQKMDQIKILSGFLQICASCKKIRDDQGVWQQLEMYFADHSKVQFSHGICPECIKKLYGDALNKE